MLTHTYGSSKKLRNANAIPQGSRREQLGPRRDEKVAEKGVFTSLAVLDPEGSFWFGFSGDFLFALLFEAFWELFCIFLGVFLSKSKFFCFPRNKNPSAERLDSPGLALAGTGFIFAKPLFRLPGFANFW